MLWLCVIMTFGQRVCAWSNAVAHPAGRADTWLADNPSALTRKSHNRVVKPADIECCARKARPGAHKTTPTYVGAASSEEMCYPHIILVLQGDAVTTVTRRGARRVASIAVTLQTRHHYASSAACGRRERSR